MMKILFVAWDSYMQEDLIDSLKKMGVDTVLEGYCFQDKEQDSYLERKLSKIIKENSVDGVFTINYFPVMARICFSCQVPYISWVFDSPMGIENPEKTLGLKTNYIFLFDRSEYEKYFNMGFLTVHHMELAVNTQRLGEIMCDESDEKKYMADISFVGKMYDSDFQAMMARLGKYEQGYINGVINVQYPLYGVYLLDVLFPVEKVKLWRRYFSGVEMFEKASDEEFRNWIHHMVMLEITRRERITLLALLSKRYQVKLYSLHQDELLPDVQFMGTVDPYQEAPKLFSLSKINLNISIKEIKTGIPLRVFDILGAGGFLLTNYQQEIAENFVDGRDLIVYTSIQDAIEKANYYLVHEEERRQIAQNGRKAIERFTFERQLQRIFYTVYKLDSSEMR